ncbi:MAG: hypothetical protein KKF48_02820 [Nanoarchaeota archaeon]|nr:hypothetical protein [Nanoarchaeota archaeon]MBU1027955.1 hypothetical protein [Nanoarchaeota archaeon]
MATGEIVLQHWVLTKFAYPFLLMFFIVFAILEKTKVFGEDKKQLNALVSFVIGLIFVSAVFPKLVVSNLILFLSVALVVVFVALLIWSFVIGGDAKIGGKGVKIAAAIVLVIVMIIVILWATGVGWSFFESLFNQSWSNSFWINVFFVVVIAIALALILANAKKKD